MGKKVFLVDDSDLIRSMATMALEQAGHQVRALPDWPALDRALREERPDLILMDVNMPEMTGDFALTFFKEERGLVHVPILLYSDIEEQALVKRAQACGADGYISKSWGLQRLTETVGYFLDRAG